MSTRIDRRFAALQANGEKGFIAYVTAGDPNLKATEDIVLRLGEVGVDIVELGIPFSDPLADGPVNQASAARALEAGTTLEGVLDMVQRIRRHSGAPAQARAQPIRRCHSRPQHPNRHDIGRLPPVRLPLWIKNGVAASHRRQLDTRTQTPEIEKRMVRQMGGNHLLQR